VSEPAEISIAVETENDGAQHRIRLADTLRAIREQTRADRVLEVLIASTRPPNDGQIEAMEGLPARWLTRPGLRYYDLKNAAIAESRGRLVMLVDSDVVPQPDYVEKALAVFERAGRDVAGVTGRTRFQDGPFSMELAVAQLPNQEREPGDTTHFLAHNAVFRGDVLRADSFRGGHIRLNPDSDLARRLIAAGLRIEYRPELRATHNYARNWREIAAHCIVIGYHDARFQAFIGRQPRAALLDTVGRFRALTTRYARLRTPMGISLLRAPLSILFFAWYSLTAGRGYASFLRGEPEPFAEF
jgi:hypothetical protein